MRHSISMAATAILLASPAAAQTVRGTLLDESTGKPLVNMAVSALQDTATVARSRTDSSGVFYLTLPTISLYQVAFGEGPSQLYSPPFIIGPNDTLQRTFSIVVGIVYEDKVDSSARLLRTNVRVAYPENLRKLSKEGDVKLRFIIDSTGTVRPGSVRIVRSADRDFNESVLRSVHSLKFAPAVRNGVAVAQLVTQSYTFRLGKGFGTLPWSTRP